MIETKRSQAMKKYAFEMKEKSGKIAVHCFTCEAKNKKEAASIFMSAQGTEGTKPKFKPVLA